MKKGLLIAVTPGRNAAGCAMADTASESKETQMKPKNRGFSLLELLIVVAIILIIATIAIPSLLRSRQSANESAAIASVRTMTTAQITYLSSSGGSYGNLALLIGAGLLDTGFNSTKSGYNYSIN